MNNDKIKDFRKKIMEASFKKSLGDFLQEINNKPSTFKSFRHLLYFSIIFN